MAVGTDDFADLMRLEARQRGLPALPKLTVAHPLGGIQPAAVTERAATAIDDLVAGLTANGAVQSRRELAADTVPTRGEPAAQVELPAHPLELATAFDERGWSDGLPVIPPTEELVAATLAYTDRDRLDVVGVLPPRQAPATVEAIAVNAVMAGCEPRVFPVVLAAIEALVDPAHNVTGLNATTHPVAEFILVNGPIARELGVHSGSGCFGPAFRANLTIGRALRLVLLNLGGARPGEGDRATQGSPAKLAFCAAEDEERSPWSPFQTTRGFDATTSTVTVFGAEGPHNIRDGDSNDALGLLQTIAGSMSQAGSNNLLHRGEPLLALAPEHAATIAADGWDRAQVQQYLFEHARFPAHRLSPELRRAIAVRDIPEGAEGPEQIEDFAPDALLPIADGPQSIHIFVAGGAGKHSSWMPSWGRTTLAVTRAIADRQGAAVASVEELRAPR